MARRGGSVDCSHGFAAVGMPPGCVLAALPARRFALRSMLSGTAPVRLSLPALQAAEARRLERQRRRRVDASREEVLRLLRAELVGWARADGETAEGAAEAAAERVMRRALEDARGAPGGGALDIFCTVRGQCCGCVACPGYALPPLRSPLNSTLVMCCLACGCIADAHEDVGHAAKARAGADDDDVTRRKMKPPEDR